MPNQPNTPGVMTAIQTICTGLQVGGSTFFLPANVTTGKFKDITNNVPACEITQATDIAKRYSVSGGLVQSGQIDDGQLFLIEVTLDMTDSVAVETQLAQIRDSLSQAFMASATLATAGVGYSGWEGDGTSGYAYRNGLWWRAYKRKLHVRYMYNAVMTI